MKITLLATITDGGLAVDCEVTDPGMPGRDKAAIGADLTAHAITAICGGVSIDFTPDGD